MELKDIKGLGEKKIALLNKLGIELTPAVKTIPNKTNGNSTG